MTEIEQETLKIQEELYREEIAEWQKAQQQRDDMERARFGLYQVEIQDAAEYRKHHLPLCYREVAALESIAASLAALTGRMVPKP